jgi:hypothetical protein
VERESLISNEVIGKGWFLFPTCKVSGPGIFIELFKIPCADALLLKTRASLLPPKSPTSIVRSKPSASAHTGSAMEK